MNIKKVGLIKTLAQISSKICGPDRQTFTHDLKNTCNLLKTVILIQNLPNTHIIINTHLDLLKKLWMSYKS